MIPGEIDRGKAIAALQQTHDHMIQLRLLIADLPPEARHGRLLRIFELVEIVGQGLETIEDAIAGQEATEEDL